ncbi:MAG: Hsp20/alpha crystallin family protein [Pirellulaceae bacterium]
MNQTISKRRNPSLARSTWPGNWGNSLLESLLGNMPEDMNGEFSQMMQVGMDVAETDRAFEVSMDLPGVKADDVDVHLENNTLTIRGKRETQNEEKDEAKQYHRIERFSGNFSRSVLLPGSVSEDEAVAEFRDGVLKIIVPKTEEARPKKIKVRA